MADLDTEIVAFETMRSDLAAHHMGEWVLIHDEKLIGTFRAFDDAAQEAVKMFGRGPYLIRQIGAPPISLPASLMYNLHS